MADDIEMYTYSTGFNLEYPVNDISAARAYLDESGMVMYLKNDPRLKKYEFADEDIDALINIQWKLRDEDSGEIVLTTSKKLTAKQLAGVSDWISGQCSDGLGEGFEQQDFACYRLDDDYGWADDPDDDSCYQEDEWVEASFDWRTNNYELTLV